MSKVWFITGAGSGIGAGTAKAALKAGNRVVATGRKVEKCAMPCATRQARTCRFFSWTSPMRRRSRRPSTRR